MDYNSSGRKKSQKDIDLSELLQQPSLLATDTRDLEAKKFFICFSGENYDSHDFVEQLIANEKLKYIFVEKDLDLVSDKLVKVPSTLGFYHYLAHQYRLLVGARVIGLTGSAGKTTTKNLLQRVFAKK